MESAMHDLGRRRPRRHGTADPQAGARRQPREEHRAMRTRRLLSRRQFVELTSAAAAGAAAVPLLKGPAAVAAPLAAQTAGGTLNYAEAGDFEDFNPWAFA